MWIGFFTIWQLKGNQTPMGWSRPSTPRLRGRSCIAIYDTALQVVQHTLSVKAITNLPRLKGRGTRLYLLTGMGQDPIVDGYVGQEVLLQSSQKNTACVIHILATSIHIPPTCKIHASLPSNLPYASACSPVTHYLHQVKLWVRLLRCNSLSIDSKVQFLYFSLIPRICKLKRLSLRLLWDKIFRCSNF